MGTPLILMLLTGVPPDPGARVVLPIDDWERLKEAARPPPPEAPVVRVAPIDRSVSGSFERGLFRASLTSRFEVLEDVGHVRVPVVASSVSLGTVLLDGKRTSVLREAEFYTVGVDAPGRHELQIELFVGRQQDRFARQIDLTLPDGGPTSFSVRVPEQGIEARLKTGVLMDTRATGTGTELSGFLDVSGRLSLGWSRKLRHEQPTSVRMEARINSVVTVQEAVVTGLAVIDIDVLEGETDRLDLQLPQSLEVSAVEGDSVLQWRTEAKEQKLIVLLKHLVDDHASLSVKFQAPVEGQSVSVRVPWMAEGTQVVGTLGVTAPAGLDVRREGASESVEPLGARDIPTELADLAETPLLFAFGFTHPPTVALKISRHQEVELTSTIVDELQASTVLIESGSEITKLKLRIRNNTRQYLSVRLPSDAVLTHSLIDGQPVRPAVAGNAESGGPEELLLPLRQSERMGAGRRRIHIVRPGETLSDVANIYYSDPSEWQPIQEANPSELAGEELHAGQELVVPALRGTVEESSFVVELAYRRNRPAMPAIGRAEVVLPELDVDTVVAVWHLYLPEAVTPLSVSSNLTQYSKLRYDPFRRVRDFLEQAFSSREAWAGGEYRSILSQRKEIWQAENERKSGGEIVLSSFPLTGERLRFKRILLGRERPEISVVFASNGVGSFMRVLAFLLSFLVALRLISTATNHREPKELLITAAGLGLVLCLAHFFLGMHRRIVWGIDLALFVSLVLPLLPNYLSRAKALVESPWRLSELLTLRNVLFLAGVEVIIGVTIFYPLLTSTVTLVVLGLVAKRARRIEVAHG
ncbi:MAG: LysM peptidoglycan-binding domain-containing protein [Deltaproteobacteria bacterium]|nr:LysM peptidoglycan-binding domain-containing protein [Deltaproteobacteria bacterium]